MSHLWNEGQILELPRIAVVFEHALSVEAHVLDVVHQRVKVNVQEDRVESEDLHPVLVQLLHPRVRRGVHVHKDLYDYFQC